MSALRPPGLGPIIGHTTDRTCRLWIQADDPEDKGARLASNRRTVGVIGLLSSNRRSVLAAYYFRLQREFDRTGTFVLGKDVELGRHDLDRPDAAKLGIRFVEGKPYALEPDKEYCVRMATLSIDDPMPDDESLSDIELSHRLPLIERIQSMLLDLDPEKTEARFRTFPEAGTVQPKMSFLLGSCRYPGLLWKVKEADKIFEPMLGHLQRKDGAVDARFTLMVGDQIYADTLNRHIPVGLADTYEEFQERYQTAFSSPNMRDLLRTAPTYMILDDHEIEDNWTQDRLADAGKHQLFNLAVGAYMSYQWSHGPRSFGRLLYYKFICGGYPFFVLDTRTQRFKDDTRGLEDNHLLGRPTIDPRHRSQLGVLLDWLSEQQKRHKDIPKFIGSASVFAPNAIDERVGFYTDPAEALCHGDNADRQDGSDSWPAYPRTRRAILDHIVREGIQNVVFLTGDIHCANVARMTFSQGGRELDLVAYDITSSAFYWPFVFADGDPNNYVHDSTAREQKDSFPIEGGEMNYTAWAFTQEDNFCKVAIDQAARRLTATYHDRKGNVIEVADRLGNLMQAVELALAPW